MAYPQMSLKTKQDNNNKNYKTLSLSRKKKRRRRKEETTKSGGVHLRSRGRVEYVRPSVCFLLLKFKNAVLGPHAMASLGGVLGHWCAPKGTLRLQLLLSAFNSTHDINGFGLVPNCHRDELTQAPKPVCLPKHGLLPPKL